MTSQSGTDRPIIIKRKKVVAGGGHHGGAWKVAYADFVTAMMAFFLLMWLLNATTEDQRIALATYFTPTISISNNSGGGDGALGGDTIFAEDTLTQMGTGATEVRPAEAQAARGDTGSTPEVNDAAARQDVDIAAAIESALLASGGETNLADELLQHIRTEVSDDGVLIEISGLPDAALFERGGDQPTDRLAILLDMIGSVLPLVQNDIAVIAYRQDGITPVSGSDRAEAVAGLLTRHGLSPERIERVTGHATRETGNLVTGIRPDDRVKLTILRN